MKPATRKDADVLNRFLRTYFEDRESGSTRSLGDYQALHPGYEDLIAGEHERLLRGEGPTDLTSALGGHPAGARIGPYRVVRELGRGGQGTVLLAEDGRLGRRVALKVLTGFASLSSEHLLRFHREAALASRLDHPGLCSVYESDTIDGVPYVAMRYVEGETLAAKIADARRRGAALAPRDVLGWVVTASRALAVAHRAGIVHRDVKPANLMITPAGEPVVLDFGLARELDGAGTTLTRTGELFGTPAYMAPEQLDESVGSCDGRTDVWALGVVLYEALSLSLPFQAPTREGLYRAILTSRPAAGAVRAGGLPPTLRTVISTAMAAEPDRRYASADALAEDLTAVLEGRPISARPVGPIARLALWARREPALAGTLATVLVLLLAATGLGGYLIAAQERLHAGESVLRAASLNELLNRAMSGRMSDRSVSEMHAVLEAEPELDYLRAALVHHALFVEDEDTALALIDAVPATSSEPAAFERLRVDALRRLGRDAEAQAITGELSDPAGPLDSFIAGRLAQAHVAPGRPGSEEWAQQALDLYLRSALLEEEPYETLYHCMLQAAVAAGERDLARLVADTLEHRGPAWWWACFFSGGARARHSEGARSAYERSIELDPEFAQPYTSLAVLTALEGDLEEADRLYLRSIDLTFVVASKVRLHLAWERTMRLLEEPELGLAACERALELDPDSPEVLARMGRLYQDLELYDEADEVLFRALELDPSCAEAKELLRMASPSGG
ncbi:MAG: serine/threonine-protein kinase [Planctomycetota bacterium]